MIKGIKQGVGIFLGFCATAIFAYTVSGTIKTWTSGENLTAADLNTTIQSLKTAVESAGQYGETVMSATQGNTRYAPFTAAVSSLTEVLSVAPRAMLVKNARIIVVSNASLGDCTITLRKNSIDTNISMVIPAGSTTAVTDTDTVSVVQGDTLSWRSVCAGVSAANIASIITTFEF